KFRPELPPAFAVGLPLAKTYEISGLTACCLARNPHTRMPSTNGRCAYLTIPASEPTCGFRRTVGGCEA
ncbi:MAG: hypothetical protein ACP5O7_09540, partial [Phycisphaerae bacterium]